jgi:RNA polymerase sigma-70 factor (ECF subfamily)|tara:strand:- start:5200 stop:5751 length:552 start_codon:yes stop_codon:yes gene_type:complete
MNLIISEINKRNKYVFKKLFNKHYKGLVIYANGYLFDMDSSKDIVQDVFIYIWEYSGKLNIKTSLKAYLYSMVRNRCLNYLKSIKVTDNFSFLDFNISLITEEVYDSSSEQDKSKVYNKVLEIVDTLPEKMQQVVKLKFLHNYKYAQIAEELGVSINTVKTQLKRAKYKITQMVTTLLVFLQI